MMDIETTVDRLVEQSKKLKPQTPREVLRGLAPLACPASWPVGEVTVVASTLGGTGSGYEVVGRVAVGA